MAENQAKEPARFNPFSRFRAFLRRSFGIKSYFELGKIRPPLLICFDHLYSEYRAVKHQVERLPNEDCADFVKSLPGKRGDGTLSWSDLYHFQLILADALPAEQLRTKIRRLRFDYRSVAGEKEFDDYMTSKPPDLQSPPQPTEDQSEAHYIRLLRDDLKDLLGRMYLEYAILPVREERLTDLTWVAARLCLFSLLALLGILGILFFVPLFEIVLSGDGTISERFARLDDSGRLSSLTIFVVVIAGAMGGFVSALQRIQSPRSEGDSVYNLSLLFHGSYSVFVAPITGGIFAIVLYLLFTSGTLEGTFFPRMFTPIGRFTDAKLEQHAPPSPTPAASPASAPPASVSPSASPLSSPSTETSQIQPPNPGEVNGSPSPQLSPSSSPSPQPTGTPDNNPRPTPIPQPVLLKGINVFEFLAQSGPASGQAYALLIVWCFIAGFAERFVPDALDRLIANGKGAKKQ